MSTSNACSSLGSPPPISRPAAPRGASARAWSLSLNVCQAATPGSTVPAVSVSWYEPSHLRIVRRTIAAGPRAPRRARRRSTAASGRCSATLPAWWIISFMATKDGCLSTRDTCWLSQATRNHGPATRSEAGSLPVVQPCEGMLFQFESQRWAGSITCGRWATDRKPFHSACPSPG